MNLPVYSANQIRQWDKYTILHEPISSLDLMERAAAACADWLISHRIVDQLIVIVCHTGNNGGDGLAIARLLSTKNIPVTIYITGDPAKGSEDFLANLERMRSLKLPYSIIGNENEMPAFDSEMLVVDALFGTGLDRPLTGIPATLVKMINESGCRVVSIDMPSGLYADRSSNGNAVIMARHTLSFQAYKLALLMPENSEFFGNVHILDIGLDPLFRHLEKPLAVIIDDHLAARLLKQRDAFGHKGTFGHALLLAGSQGKMGAAVLCAEACLRSGAGLLTVHVPACGVDILQASLPEAMVSADTENKFIATLTMDTTGFDAVGIGPGIGLEAATGFLLEKILTTTQMPVVIDADGLNLLAKSHHRIYFSRPCILTPHPKEFDRLFGASENSFDRFALAISKSKELNCVIVLKGHRTLIACPDGTTFFNSTGNSGMSTAGSGDVLTGVLTGLLAQGYDAKEATLLGVYLHGLAGDQAAHDLSEEAMLASDITSHLGKAFLRLHSVRKTY